MYRQGLPVFTNIEVALNCTTKVLKENLSIEELGLKDRAQPVRLAHIQVMASPDPDVQVMANTHPGSQCFGSVFIFSGSRGRGWRSIQIRIRIRIQGFNDQKLKKNNR
jgi:hypothetical protein